MLGRKEQRSLLANTGVHMFVTKCASVSAEFTHIVKRWKWSVVLGILLVYWVGNVQVGTVARCKTVCIFLLPTTCYGCCCNLVTTYYAGWTFRICCFLFFVYTKYPIFYANIHKIPTTNATHRKSLPSKPQLLLFSIVLYIIYCSNAISNVAVFRI